MNLLNEAVRRALARTNHGNTGVNGAVYSLLPEPDAFFAQNNDEQTLAPFHSVATGGFGVSGAQESVEGTMGVLRSDRLLLLHCEAKLLGFASLLVLESLSTAHLHGIVLSQEMQGKGSAEKLVRAALSDLPCRYLTFSTQSPRMFCLARKLTDWMFPDPGHLPLQSEEVVQVYAAVAERRGCEVNLQTGIIRDKYEACLYRAIPRSRDDMVNDWFDDSLEIADGTSRHALFFIGALKKQNGGAE
jgi:hypothetical protein